MSDSGRKRCRKTKLVPRDCGDDEGFLQEPARKKSLLEKIKTGSDAASSPETPLQFSVKVEVEDIEDSHTDADPSNYMKYLFSLSQDTSACAEPETSLTELGWKSADDKDDEESQDSVPEASTRCDDLAYIMDANKMYKIFPMLLKKFPNDKEAVMHCRNLWGKAFHEIGCYDTTLSTQDAQLQNVIMQWRTWQITSKTRDSPFSYKCYICNDAWWSFYDFRNHIRIHPAATLKLEIVHRECNIIVYEGKAPLFKEIFVDGKCFKCAKTFTQHQESKVRADVGYFCVHCNDTLQTCTALLRHVGMCHKNPLRTSGQVQSLLNDQEFKDYRCKVCGVIFLTKPAQLEHLGVCHMVRSDDPIVTSHKTCRVCNKAYYSFPYHVCCKKNILHACKHCGAKFQNKHMLDCHIKFSRKPVSCTKCHKGIERFCMAPEHYAMHSNNFQIAYRCLVCKKIKLYLSADSMRQHRRKAHNKVSRPCADKILIPNIMLEHCLENAPRGRAFNKKGGNGQQDTVNLYDKVKGKSYRLPSRRNTEDKNEEEDVDIETNDTENEDDNKLEKIKQITESIDIKPDILVKEEKCSDDEEVKPDISKVLEETAASLLELDYTDIKVEEEELYGTQPKKSCETQKQREINSGKKNVDEIEDVAKITQLEDNQEQINKEVAIKVEQADPDDIQKEIDAAETTDTEKKDTTVKENIKPIKFKALTPKQLKAKAKTAIANAKPKPDLTKTKPAPEKTQPRILNNEIANIFNVSQSILDPVTVKLEIKDGDDYDDNDMIILRTSENSVKQETSSDNSELNLLGIEPEAILNAGYKKRKVYKCAKCDFSGFHKEYREHIGNYCMVHSKGKTDEKVSLNYSCTKCGRGFPCLKKYALHFTEHGCKHMACPQCCLVFDTLTRFMPHLNNHIKNQFMRVQQIVNTEPRNSRAYQCKTCNTIIDMKQSFQHWELHLVISAEKNENNEAGKLEAKGAFVLEADAMHRILEVLQQHTASYICGQPKIKNCFVCHRNFERQNDCKRHLIEHLLEDAFGKITDTVKLQCQICKELSQSAGVYKKHMRDHASLPIYKCSLCDKTFSDSSNFTKHKKIHNSKAFVCDICNKKFQAKMSLEKHIQIHMVTEPQICRLCQRVFHDKAFFRRHVRQHHEKPLYKYKCVICRDKFDSLRLKWDHMWAVHKQRKEAADCPICKKSYRKISDVKRHCQEEHKLSLAVSTNKLCDIVRQFREATEHVKSEQVKGEPVSEQVQSEQVQGQADDSDEDVLVIEEERETLIIFDDEVN